MTRQAGESGTPASRPPGALSVAVALALPVLLSVALLLAARRILAAGSVALAGLLLFAWTCALVGRMAAESRGAAHALAARDRTLYEKDAEMGAIRERLLEAERRAAVAGLAGSLAHDFNNLLTGIQGYARLLLDRVGPGDPIRRQLAAIVNAATRAADLASQLQGIDPRADVATAPPTVTEPPPAPPAGATAEPAAAQTASAAGRTILVVDDEPTILALAKDVLELEGYHVLVARNGEEALRVYGESRGRIDLVLLDLTMPVMGGAECFRRLRALDPAVRVVISSGFTSESVAADMMRDGALDCLQKPWEIQALAHTVAAALAREPACNAASG